MGGIREGNWQFPKLSELHMLVAAALLVVVVVVVVLRRFALALLSFRSAFALLFALVLWFLHHLASLLACLLQ